MEDAAPDGVDDAMAGVLEHVPVADALDELPPELPEVGGELPGVALADRSPEVGEGHRVVGGLPEREQYLEPQPVAEQLERLLRVEPRRPVRFVRHLTGRFGPGVIVPGTAGPTRPLAADPVAPSVGADGVGGPVGGLGVPLDPGVADEFGAEPTHPLAEGVVDEFAVGEPLAGVWYADLER